MSLIKSSFFGFGSSQSGTQSFKPNAIGMGVPGAGYSPQSFGRSAARGSYGQNQTNLAGSPGSNSYLGFAGGVGNRLGGYALKGTKALASQANRMLPSSSTMNSAARSYIPGYASMSDAASNASRYMRNSGLGSALSGYGLEGLEGGLIGARSLLPAASRLRNWTPSARGMGAAQGAMEIGKGLWDVGRLATGNISTGDYLNELDANTQVNGAAPQGVGGYISSALNSYRNGLFGNAFRGLESGREIYNRNFDNNRRQSWWGSDLSAPLTDEVKQRYAAATVPSHHMPGAPTAGIPEAQVHSDPSSWVHLARARGAGWDSSRESYDDFVKMQQGWNPATQSRADWVANPL